MIRIFSTPQPIQAFNISIQAAPIIVIILDLGILEPEIVN
jgi:hypothetical protein